MTQGHRPQLFLDPSQTLAMGMQSPTPPENAPVLQPAAAALRPGGVPGAATRGGPCAYQRVQLAGGQLNALMVDPSIQPFEQLYRRLPEEGMYNPAVSPSRPFAFELGAFRVPNNFTLVLFDLRPDIYRLSGVDPGDYVPVEARRFASIMGFEVTVDQKHPGNLLFQIDPVAIQVTSQQAYTPAVQLFQLDALNQVNVPQAAFNIAAASSFANAAGAGTGLLPQRPTRYGALDVPFNLIARSSQTVQVRCVIFRPIPSPIAFIEYDIAGILVPDPWYEAMVDCSKPIHTFPR